MSAWRGGREGGREGRAGGEKKEEGTENAHGFNKTLSGVTSALSHPPTPPPPLLRYPGDTMALIFKELWVRGCGNHV